MFSKGLKKDAKIFVAGHRGLVGSGICRKLHAEGYVNVVTRTRAELDLQTQADVFAFLKAQKPDAVIVAAAKVGGIKANSEFPADFIAQNLNIEYNLIWGSHLADVPVLLFLGSSCVYPRETVQPIPEAALLTGKPEPTNAPYALAKIAGIYLCDAITAQFEARRYFTAMPPNLYGPFDNFDLKTSHVLPALIRKFHEAKVAGKPTVEVWGPGNPRREFMHTDDAADAFLFLLKHENACGLINVGTGLSISIRELAEKIQLAVGHGGELSWNTDMPDGFPEKTMDVSALHGMGWHHRIGLDDGIKDTYEWYVKSVKDV